MIDIRRGSTPGPVAPPGHRDGTLLARGLDGLIDVAMLLFAAWTVIYHIGLLLRPPTAVLLAVWAVAGAACGGVVAVRRARSRRATGAAPSGPRPPLADTGSLVAFVTACGFAVASLFIVNTDGDDVYFVSRSVATAEHGRIPLGDVIFSQGTVGPIAGEPPVASIEVLVGSLARLLGVQAASLLWYVYLPAVVFLAVWALWRLIREWASRRFVACFVAAIGYLLWTGAGTGSLGSFHLLRMWQGKAAFVSLMVPLLYVYLTRWAEHRSRAALPLAAAASVAAIGLTSTAVFVVPLITAAVVLPLLATGRIRVALPAMAAMAYPIATGLAVTLLADHMEVPGQFHSGVDAFSTVLLTGGLGLLALCALCVCPWPARRGVPTQVTMGIAGVTALLVLPGVLALLHDATGAGAVLWRTMWVVPAPVLIGLLAAVPLPDRRWLAPLPAAVICTVAVTCGTPLWSADDGSRIAARPSWKADPERLRTARLVVAADRGGGVVLMPPAFMREVTLLTSRTNTVDPNEHYLRSLPVDRTFIEDRLLLGRLPGPQRPVPTGPEVTAALRRVGVTTACIRPWNTRGRELLRAAGYQDPTRIGRLICVFSPRPAQASMAGSGRS